MDLCDCTYAVLPRLFDQTPFQAIFSRLRKPGLKRHYKPHSLIFMQLLMRLSPILSVTIFSVLNMVYKYRTQAAYLDPHWEDDAGPVPRWRPDDQRPWKTGQSRAAFIWPRDKGQTNTPPFSWRRVKDILTGKGPGIWIGDRLSYGPHRPTWTNWLEHDNLGYRNAYDQLAYFGNKKLGSKRYDFNTRRYQTPRQNTWSDVKWERRRHPKIPHYHRDRDGEEWYDTEADINPFRYNVDTDWFDWGRPHDDQYYYGVYRQ